jgi:hypothetical protein
MVSGFDSPRLSFSNKKNHFTAKNEEFLIIIIKKEKSFPLLFYFKTKNYSLLFLKRINF